MSRLRVAAITAFGLHLVAGAGMALVLRHGLDTNADLNGRLGFLVDHRLLWTGAWLTWTAAALAILYFYMMFVAAYESNNPPKPELRFAVLMTVAAIAADLSAQGIEIGVLPGIAHQAFGTGAGVELFLMLHRTAVMMSGCVANGLYSSSALVLSWCTRRSYPRWVWLAGVAVGALGFVLSIAALLNSSSGMFWSNVVLVPSILVWLAGVALSEGMRIEKVDR